MGSLILLFWTFGDVCPEFQSQDGFLTYMLCHLCAVDSSESPLVRHLLTSWRPLIHALAMHMGSLVFTWAVCHQFTGILVEMPHTFHTQFTAMQIDGTDFSQHSTDSIPTLDGYLRLIYSKYKTCGTFVQLFVTLEQLKILLNFRTSRFLFVESVEQSKISVILCLILLVLNSFALLSGKWLLGFYWVSMDLRSGIDWFELF